MPTEFAPRHVPRVRPGPTGGRRDANRRSRTRDLCAAGLKLYLQRGVEGVTVDEIVQEAKVAKGSFYRYFRDQAELVEAIFAVLSGPMEEAFASCETALKNVRSPLDLFAAYQILARELGAAILSHPDVALLYLQECRGPAAGARRPVRLVAERIREKAIALTKVAHEHGLLRPFDARVSALAVVGAVERLLFGALSGEDVGEPEQAPAALISLILDGLRKR